jgi:hypothetical protein
MPDQQPTAWSGQMKDLDDIERRVAALNPAELELFRRWFAEFDAGAWDAQMARDAATGQLDELAQSAIKAHRAGNSQPL